MLLSLKFQVMTIYYFLYRFLESPPQISVIQRKKQKTLLLSGTSATRKTKPMEGCK